MASSAKRPPIQQRLAKILFFVLCAATVVRALRPDPFTEPFLPWDKAVHGLTFYLLTGLGAAALPRTTLVRLALGMAALGGLIEILQSIPYFHRDASWGDWAADWTGIVMALAPSLIPRVRAMMK